MSRLFSSLAIVLLMCGSAEAQNPVRPAQVIAVCAGATLTAGNFATLYVDPTGALCLGSVSISGTVTVAGTVTANQGNAGSQNWPEKIMDAAGNARGANVDANNNLGVVLPAETTKVIGTTRVLGNGGATLDSTIGAGTAPTDQMVVGGVYNSTEISPTTGQAFALQADSKGRVRIVMMDAAGNTRGANVNSSNQLSVSVDNTPNVGQSGAPWSQNVTQFGSVNVSTGTGASGTGIPRVTISNDSSLAANQSTNQSQVGGTAVVADGCQAAAKTTVAISQTASTKLISQVASKKNHFCSMLVINGGTTTETVNLVEGTGTTCGTSTAALAGSTTTANGLILAANGGFAVIAGNGTAIEGSGTNLDGCLTQSGTNRVSGFATYTQQ